MHKFAFCRIAAASLRPSTFIVQACFVRHKLYIFSLCGHKLIKSFHFQGKRKKRTQRVRPLKLTQKINKLSCFQTSNFFKLRVKEIEIFTKFKKERNNPLFKMPQPCANCCFTCSICCCGACCIWYQPFWDIWLKISFCIFNVSLKALSNAQCTFSVSDSIVPCI